MGQFEEDVGVTCRSPSQNTQVEVSVRVEILINGEDASQGSELTFMYEAPAVVTSIVPSAGAVEGSTSVQVLGSEFKAGSSLGCMFTLVGQDGGGAAKVMVAGRWETSSMMTCESPRAGAEQTVSVEVSNNGTDVTSSGVQFVYERAATVADVSLGDVGRSSCGGFVLRVTGKHFVQSLDLQCMMGLGSGGVHGVSDARYVTSSFLHCRVKGRLDKGKSVVEVSNSGHDFTTNGVSWVLHLSVLLSPYMGLLLVLDPSSVTRWCLSLAPPLTVGLPNFAYLEITVLFLCQHCLLGRYSCQENESKKMESCPCSIQRDYHFKLKSSELIFRNAESTAGIVRSIFWALLFQSQLARLFSSFLIPTSFKRIFTHPSSRFRFSMQCSNHSCCSCWEMNFWCSLWSSASM